jgi:hypothetical protein
MAKLSDLQTEALNMVQDDYESPGTIALEIASRLGRSVSEVEVLAALASLCRSGFVSPFVFDQAAQKWVAISADEAIAQPDAWFLANRTAEAC